MILLFILLSAALIVYPYCIYPVIIKILAREESPEREGSEPNAKVAVVLSVYNEEQVILEKIANVYESDLDHDLLEMIVVSDGSTDRTEELVQSLSWSGVNLIVQGRKGKTAALNKAVENCTSEILVFTDANTLFKTDTIRKLVEPFADERVGLTTGRVIPQGEDTGEGLFGRFETFLKNTESCCGIIAGADGALYAMRRSLYQPLKPEMINDFSHPITVHLAGFRSILVPEAVALEDSSNHLTREISRQRRMVNQALGILKVMLPKLIEQGKLFLVWVLVSHKLFRWLHLLFVGVLLLSLMALALSSSSVLPAVPGVLYLLLFLCSHLLVKSGMHTPKLIDLFYRFQVIHFAYGLGMLDNARGKNAVTWNPRGGA